MSTDFLLEKRLNTLNKDLHKRVTDTAFLVTVALEKYKNYFPQYTDHTVTHSLQVIDFCNRLMGEEYVNMLNEDEIYVLLMGAYLHDTGMGISEADYEALKEKVATREYLDSHKGQTVQEVIRNFHQEFSGAFITKYAMLLEIPSDEHVKAIVQVSRGHRKSDLYSEEEYPIDFKVPSGNEICLPYLASLIRLADELDIAADRNSVLLDQVDNIHWKVHRIIKTLHIEEDKFILDVDSSDEELYNEAVDWIRKLQETLDYCRDVVEKRTKFSIRQKTVEINKL